MSFTLLRLCVEHEASQQILTDFVEIFWPSRSHKRFELLICIYAYCKETADVTQEGSVIVAPAHVSKMVLAISLSPFTLITQ